MPVYRYIQPPPQYPFGAGYVAPVYDSRSPWPSHYSELSAAHEDPSGQIPPMIPPNPNPPTTWSNPWTRPPTQPNPSETPVFPTPRQGRNNALMAYDCETPYSTTHSLGAPVIPPTPSAFDTPVHTLHGTPYVNGNTWLRRAPGIRRWVPGTYPPEEYGEPTPLQLNPQLMYNPSNAGIPHLEWDIAHHPDTALSHTGRHCYLPIKTDEAALYPDVQRIYIDTDVPVLRWWMQKWGPIIVEDNDKVTVGGVMDAIYNYLHTPLTREDRRCIRESDGPENNWHHLKYSKHRRAEDAHELYHFVDRQGFKRIDVLGSLRRFKGLRFVVFASNEWKAYLGLMPGPPLVVRSY